MRHVKIHFCLVTILLLFGAIDVSAELFAGSIFNDHMVLQHGKAIEVWGIADPGETVRVQFAGQEQTAVTDGNGYWAATLAPLEINRTGEDLTIVGTKKTIVRHDVVVGDVWLCSGQSNMEMSFAWGLMDGNRFQQEANHPLIRHLKLTKRKLNTPDRSLYIDREWQACTPASVQELSGVGYFFALELSKHLDIPIGLIDASWSGCRIEPFFAPGAVDAEPGLEYIKQEIAQCDTRTPEGKRRAADVMEQIKKWYDLAQQSTPADPHPGVPPHFPTLLDVSFRQPLTQYNAMIAPMTNFPIKGVIWYQGCSNNGDSDYVEKMRALINGWRRAWNDDLPFYYVQLASLGGPPPDPAGGEGFADMRRQQRQALSIPNTAMVVTIDIGQWNDIHPKNKYDVGKRLALAALNRTYGIPMADSGPNYRSMRIEGNRIRIFFDHTDGGLKVGTKDGINPVVFSSETKLNNFAIGDDQGNWAWAEAWIEGDSVVVSSSAIAAPTKVRFAHCACPPNFNFYNGAGLPAVPFCTDLP
ncbi:sialate O-acetylesterase [Victivallaceae bacterium BBE-744-WT-12]|uniref:Sialate O-acetylesterase n=1 Tax=Victivallis lenta TaxID=2606640 RepID=A0A844G1X7_9BACT|nr:sialate O-acetylesterase [Victivallis lenta]MST97710.1 sialate O-acetylesterase [Victivallis lenta]